MQEHKGGEEGKSLFGLINTYQKISDIITIFNFSTDHSASFDVMSFRRKHWMASLTPLFMNLSDSPQAWHAGDIAVASWITSNYQRGASGGH